MLVIILILALAGAAYVILSNWDTGQAELGTVPGVVGLSEAEALVKIKAAGFNYEKEGVQPSADVAQGDVARQDPEENSKLEKGKVIGVWISSGEGKVEVPNVVGLSQAEAAAKIGAAGLEVVSKPEVNPDQRGRHGAAAEPGSQQEGGRRDDGDHHRGRRHEHRESASAHRHEPGCRRRRC